MDISKFDNIDNAMFLTKVDNIYVMLCTSIMMNDLTRVKHKVSEEIIKKYQEIVNECIKQNIRKMYDELNVKSTEITNITETKEEIIVNVKLISKYMNYYIDLNGNLMSGDNTKSQEHTNYLTLIKKKTSQELKEARKCPNCGANIDVNNDGRCQYCKGTFNTEDYDYILTKIEE